MNISEKIAEKFLKNIYNNVEFEPNGKKNFPDFVVDNKLFFEVRSLCLNIRVEKEEISSIFVYSEKTLKKPLNSIFSKDSNILIKNCSNEKFYVPISVNKPYEYIKNGNEFDKLKKKIQNVADNVGKSKIEIDIYDEKTKAEISFFIVFYKNKLKSELFPLFTDEKTKSYQDTEQCWNLICAIENDKLFKKNISINNANSEEDVKKYLSLFCDGINNNENNDKFYIDIEFNKDKNINSLEAWKITGNEVIQDKICSTLLNILRNKVIFAHKNKKSVLEISMIFFKGNPKINSTFLGNINRGKNTGFVLSEAINEINYAISEKENNNKYAKIGRENLQLIFVNDIYFLTDEDYEDIEKKDFTSNTYSKLIIINNCSEKKVEIDLKMKND